MEFSLRFQHIDEPHLRLTYSKVPWDTHIFGYGVGQIDGIDVGDDVADAARCYRRFADWMDEQQIALASCRLDHTKLRESMLLEAHEFRFVEMTYKPVLVLERELHGDDAIEVSVVEPEELRQVEQIAGTAFTTGRYKVDPRIENGLSDSRYLAWVRSSASRPEHELLKARHEGKIVGFFVVERTSEVAYWHLTAMAPDAQGRGLGSRVWRAMMRHASERGCSRVETTISAHNLPVINLYGRLGFRLSSAQMTLHWVRGR